MSAMRYQKLSTSVASAYAQSDRKFGQWVWRNHVRIVARYAEELALRFDANVELAVAGALLHDFGDAFVDRADPSHTAVTQQKGSKLLEQSGYTPEETTEIFQVIIPPHSCRDGEQPTTLEGKVLATADALAHLNTDFYLQFAWMNLPEVAHSFQEYQAWVQAKIERDFHHKIQFVEIKQETEARYIALRSVYCGDEA